MPNPGSSRTVAVRRIQCAHRVLVPRSVRISSIMVWHRLVRRTTPDADLPLLGVHPGVAPGHTHHPAARPRAGISSERKTG
jgi:hypothetical protein